MSAIIAWVVILLMTVVFHEVAHGLVAYRLGDDTAKRAGRLTLNPLKHLDPFWTVLLPLVLFITTQGRFMIGMAKPVPVNFNRLRSPRMGMILVALAGPAANFAFAALLNVLYKMTGMTFFVYAIYFNLGLAFFNLIPIPPLDGSRIVAGILPTSLANLYLGIEKYGFLIILVLYFTGILFEWIIPGINLFCTFLEIPKLAIQS